MKSNYWKLPKEEQEKLAESGALTVRFFSHGSYYLNLEEFFTAHNIDLNAMATKNSLGGWKQPLIHFAFNLGITDLKSKLKSAKYLLTQGANINAQDENGLTALDKVLGLGAQNPIRMVLFLLKNGAIPRDDYSPAQKHMYNTVLKKLPLAEQERLDLVNAAKLQAEQIIKLQIEQNELFEQRGKDVAAAESSHVNPANYDINHSDLAAQEFEPKEDVPQTVASSSSDTEAKAYLYEEYLRDKADADALPLKKKAYAEALLEVSIAKLARERELEKQSQQSVLEAQLEEQEFRLSNQEEYLQTEQNEIFDQGGHDAATDDHNVNLASAAQTLQEDDSQPLGDLAIIPQ